MSIAVTGKGTAQPGDSLTSDVSLPALVIHNQALEHNIRWMQRFVSDSGAERAVSPPTGRRRLGHDPGDGRTDPGGVCPRCQACADGQPIGRAPNMAVIADLLADSMFEFHCMVDHPDNVAALGEFFAARGLRLNVMIEYGVPAVVVAVAAKRRCRRWPKPFGPNRRWH